MCFVFVDARVCRDVQTLEDSVEQLDINVKVMHLWLVMRRNRLLIALT